MSPTCMVSKNRMSVDNSVWSCQRIAPIPSRCICRKITQENIPSSLDEPIPHRKRPSVFRSAASSAQPHQLLACGCNAHDSIPVLLALCSQSFDCLAAWVLDSTCRPCLSDRMLAIIYVLADRACFSCAVLVTIPGLFHALLLDAFFRGCCTHPSYRGCGRLKASYHAWPCISRRLLAP